ncbi:hypothetical protein [Flagellimonas onchidii]|uniref:hypothetical protein n=1 Tax=Flagellimonas onchidii TaxID=2562684 RepID=UPI0010A63717|nr:hypothetical protein [Allomuricauda onchidii]
MKTKSLILFLSFSLTILFISCSDENDTTQNETNFYPETIIGTDAFQVKFGHQNLENNLELEILIPENINGFSKNELLILFPFYQSNTVDSKVWSSIPTLQIESGYKIIYSRQDHSNLTLFAEKSNSNLPYENPIELKNLTVIAVKTSSLKGLTRNDLDIRNYMELINHYNLKE